MHEWINEWMNRRMDGRKTFNWSITSDTKFISKIYIYIRTYIHHTFIYLFVCVNSGGNNKQMKQFDIYNNNKKKKKSSLMSDINVIEIVIFSYAYIHTYICMQIFTLIQNYFSFIIFLIQRMRTWWINKFTDVHTYMYVCRKCKKLYDLCLCVSFFSFVCNSRKVSIWMNLCHLFFLTEMTSAIISFIMYFIIRTNVSWLITH